MNVEFLEEVIKDKYVLLNRAPTLHRLSIEAFKIVLMPGKTIRIHPLVCPSFNADFDGDQMAVHLPISDEAQKEAKELIAADKNILKPWSWDPTIAHAQDMVLGIYYLTDFFDKRYADYNTEDERLNKTPIKGRFDSLDDVMMSVNNGNLYVKDKILLKLDGDLVQTTVGRVIFNLALPEELRFTNHKYTIRDLKWLLSKIFDECGMARTVVSADAIKDLWFKYATIAATSVNVLDMKVPKEKDDVIKWWDDNSDEIYKYYFKWFFSEEEKHRLIIQVWTETKSKIEWHMKEITGAGDDLFTMVDSWARWSMSHVVQISGMKWLVVDPNGEIIELPVKWSYVEWLRPIEYFLSAHSWRKWKADTALKTAESGYLTRKLCDSSQETIVREEDCKTSDYLLVSKAEADLTNEDFYKNIYGRVLAEDVQDEKGNIIVKAGELLKKKSVEILEEAKIELVKIRSALTCENIWGLCQKCYGMDLATREYVEIGTPVWIIAAQSIGEPATQLTMRTFHTWGVADAADMTQGIDRIKQLFEIRAPKNPAVIAPFDGDVSIVEKNKIPHLMITSDYHRKNYVLKKAYEIVVKKWDEIEKGWHYSVKWRSKQKVKEGGTVLEVHDDRIVLWVKENVIKNLAGIKPFKNIENQKAYKWDVLTTGMLDITEYKNVVWDLQAQRYIISETKKVYAAQGQWLNDKHIEVVVRQLFSKVAILDSGDTGFVPGIHVNYWEFLRQNTVFEEQGKRPARWERLALGLTNIAKWTESWLSAASFQETIRVMVGASLRWAVDTLSDLKSNVIIGRLLPIGEIYRNSLKKWMWTVKAKDPKKEESDNK